MGQWPKSVVVGGVGIGTDSGTCYLEKCGSGLSQSRGRGIGSWAASHEMPRYAPKEGTRSSSRR